MWQLIKDGGLKWCLEGLPMCQEDPPWCIVHVAACFRFTSHLILKEKNNMPKGCMMAMADPLDLGHGKNTTHITDRKCIIQKAPKMYISTLCVKKNKGQIYNPEKATLWRLLTSIKYFKSY